jgi:beta-lactamase class A
MQPGNSYTTWNLIRLMIVLSDNVATRMIIDHLGMDRINAYLRSIGLTRTTVSDPTMLNELPATDVNLTTPLEMAYLIRIIKEGYGFSKKGSEEMLTFMRGSRYRWGIPRGIGNKAKVANKTGNLEGVYNDVGLVYTNKGNYVLTIFTKDFKGKRREARELINNISRAVYEEYTGEKIEIKSKSNVRKNICRK